ncbi:hypothetical protein HMPREF1861_01302 [Corynebacterium kroppenstedtii]|nr:hypothetical protein HMPREF1861_01302 [Corynebacterium kroppenstedtii]
MCLKWHGYRVLSCCSLRSVISGVPSPGLDGAGPSRGSIGVSGIGCCGNLSRVSALQRVKMA